MTKTRAITPPEPGLSADELLGRARALAPVLRKRQVATEAAGRLLDETHADFLEAGFYRMLQPRRFGGYEIGLRDFVRVMSEIARGCPSSGWVLALTAGHPHLLSHWNEQAQAETYGSDGDARVPGRAVQPGRAVPTDGGLLVSGTWDYASGCDHSTHFMASAILEGTEPPRLLWLLLNRTDYEIVDNWDPIALRGTGSKRVVCENVLVPEHWAITAAVGPGTGRAPGWRTHANPLYAGGLFSFLFFELGAIAIGSQRGAIDAYEATIATKRLDIPPFVLRGEVDEYQHHLGKAVGLVDLGEAALLEGADRYLAQAARALEADEPVDEDDEETRRLLLLQQNCIRLAGEATSLLLRTGGTSGARNGSPIANATLALQVMQTHMGLQWDRTATNVGRLRLGMEAGFL